MRLTRLHATGTASLPPRLGNRADHRDLLERGQRIGHDVSRAAEVVLLSQEIGVLPLNVGARYHVTPTVVHGPAFTRQPYALLAASPTGMARTLQLPSAL